MIYDQITRQRLEIVGRYPSQRWAHKLGQKVAGNYSFAKVKYLEHLPGFSGGFPVGTERDVDINDMVADDGYSEIRKAYDAAPELA
jgi:hypothetical protein